MSSKTTIILVGIGGIAVIAGILAVVITMSNRAKQSMLERQTQEYAAPAIAVKRQVRKITLKKQTKSGEITIEIEATGLVTYRNAQGKIIKTGHQGFATTSNLFESVNQALDGKIVNLPDGYSIIVETNQGTTTIDSTTTGSSDTDDPSGNDTIVDDIDDFIDTALNPTPTPKASSTPTPTPTPTTTSDASPSPSSTPSYLTVPAFTCEDYYKTGMKPLKISNVYCGLQEP